VSRPLALTREQALAVREAYAGGLGTAKLARTYDVSEPTIRNVIKGRHTAVADLPDITVEKPGRETGWQKRNTAAARTASETPNDWQADSANIASIDLRHAAWALIDRKLSGPKRAQARQWVYFRRNAGPIHALMQRLDNLPDLGGES